MCGLVGMMGNVVQQDKRALQTLMVLDWTRGKDSTGLAVVNKFNEEILIAKALGDPFNLFNSFDLFDGDGEVMGNHKVYIGHNRAATFGKVNEENAHPFSHGEVVGAHNGTIKNVRLIPDFEKFGTDSEAIFYNIAGNAPLAETIGKLHGAYALTWWDGYEGKMNFLRNSERPLFFARRTDRDVIFWASEKWMLDVALGKARISYKEIEEFKANQHYTMDLENCTTEFRKLDMVDNGEIKGWVAPPVTYRTHTPHGNNTNPFYGRSSNQSATTSSSVKKQALEELKKFEGKVVEFWTGQEHTALSGNKYLAGFLMDAQTELRIYNDKHDNYQLMKGNTGTFKAKVKKAVVLHFRNGKKEAYLLPDMRTVERVVKTNNVLPFRGEPLDDYLTGFNGRYLSPVEWKSATKSGCCYCGGGACSDEHEEYEWVSHTEFLCTECKVNPAALNTVSTIYGYGFS